MYAVILAFLAFAAITSFMTRRRSTGQTTLFVLIAFVTFGIALVAAILSYSKFD